jgi:hypothetical protein
MKIHKRYQVIASELQANVVNLKQRIRESIATLQWDSHFLNGAEFLRIHTFQVAAGLFLCGSFPTISFLAFFTYFLTLSLEEPG